MRHASRLACTLLCAVPVALAAACGGSESSPASVDAGVDAPAPPPPPPADAGPPLLESASKVDVLLVLDDSVSMSDKAALLASSVGALARKLSPNADLHLGVITSSLGTMGGDICPSAGALNRLAHLATTGPGGAPVAGAQDGVLRLARGGDVDAFVAGAEALVLGVGQVGCGFEAQLESAYRFLVQPDPWAKVTLDAQSKAVLTGTDDTVLAQRAAFLRPDSLVVVVLLTDEEDASIDPLSIGGQGWAFGSTQFPGSPVFRADGKTTTAPRATSVCATDPASPDCTSCGFAATCNAAEPACQKLKADPNCALNGGYYGSTQEQLNVRFHRMRERFGLDPQYPISRYVDGFSKDEVPDRASDHDAGGKYIGTPKCRNPLFAATLPTSSADELCNRPRGARPPEFIVFVPITGVPYNLVDGAPQWTAILGANPDAYDLSGIDAHMVQSTTARPGLPAPTAVRGDNGTDPIHGREWDTGGDDLQYACTFALPALRTCTVGDSGCDCAQAANPPLCGANTGEQLRAKAYPGSRPLRVARGLGAQAIAASICPPSTTSGYASTMTALADRLAAKLGP